jgi:glycosyltransferase involved in cell wall biosynthesis
MYNEASTIEEVLDKVAAVELNGINKEIIVADDGSTDDSAELVKHSRLAQADLIKVYTSPVNLGKGAAVRCGLKIDQHSIQGASDRYGNGLQSFQGRGLARYQVEASQL